MSNRARIIDFLGRPEFLRARETIRKAGRLAVGASSRARLALTQEGVPGLLSIVVPMYGVERYIGECLESLLNQNYAKVQVVVVDDGSPDRSFEVARAFARRDPRVEIVRQANGGLSAARNTGMRHARGEFLAFLDSDDFVDRHAYSGAIDSLNRSGSDFAVLPYRREKNGGFPPAAPWVRDAHSENRTAVSLKQFPEIMVNAVAWSKVYRRDFWDRNGFEFPVGLLYEDQAVSMAAYAAAESFDVLSHVSINWRIRGDQSSITQQVTTSRNIADHLTAVRHSIDELERYGADEARGIRLVQIMNNNLGEFLPNIRQMDDSAWTQFLGFLSYLTSHTTDEMWRHVEARKKVLIGLCVRGHRDLALQFLSERGWDRDHFAGSLSGHSLVAELPFQEELGLILPETAFIFSEEETMLTAVARRIRQEAGDIRVELFAYVNHLRMDVEPTELEATLISPSGSRIDLNVERRSSQQDSYGHTRRYADMSVGAASLFYPSSALSEDGDYTIELTMRAGALQRKGLLRVDGITTFSIPTELGGSGRLLNFESNSQKLAIFRVAKPSATILSAVLEQRTARLKISSDRQLDQVFLERRRDRFNLRRSAARLRSEGSGLWTAEIKLPRLLRSEHGPSEYCAKVTDSSGESLQLSAHLTQIQDSGSHILLTTRLHTRDEAAGNTLLVDISDAILVNDAALRDGSLMLSVREPAGQPRLAKARARLSSTSVKLSVEHFNQGCEVGIPLWQDPWGLGRCGLKPGQYRLRGRDEAGAPVRFYPNAAFAAKFPFELTYGNTRVNLSRSPDGLLRLNVEAALADDERGGGDRWRLRDLFYSLTPSEQRRSVLFRNLYGESANDSALAVHRELRRRGSDLDLIWAVKDDSVWVPEGAIKVYEESHDYYEAFGTANYVMVNVHQPDWYKKPAGQVLVETFHGYPFKMNGRRWWTKLGFEAERQESFFRRAEEWDYLVSPAQYATPFLKEFYREGATIDTNILEIGYPRNDALINEQSAELREDTRRRLGIPQGKRVILYAPTFRDYLSSDDMSAKLVDDLDVEQLMRDLGPDYILLLRGHAFHARSGTSLSDSFINVTDYPDINHLILASDIGVLDYSSLRFDYALVQKPTFFYVPDLARYFERRESFAPYEDTSPGPHVRTQEALVKGIRNADAVARDFENARLRFLNTYMELEDGQAARRLVDEVFVPKGDALPLC